MVSSYTYLYIGLFVWNIVLSTSQYGIMLYNIQCRIYIVYREDGMIPWHEDLVWKTACLENSMVSCIAQNIVCAEFLSASCDSQDLVLNIIYLETSKVSWYIQYLLWSIVRLEQYSVIYIRFGVKYRLFRKHYGIMLYVGYREAYRFSGRQYGAMVYIGFSVECRISRKQFGTRYIQDIVQNAVYLENSIVPWYVQDLVKEILLFFFALSWYRTQFVPGTRQIAGQHLHQHQSFSLHEHLVQYFGGDINVVYTIQ